MLPREIWARMSRGFKRVLGIPPTDIEGVIHSARKFPRYVDHAFTFRGLTFKVPDYISVAYQLRDFFAEGRMDFRSESATPVIIDCGANVGVSVIRFRQLYPSAKIIAFEADSRIFAYLEQNLKDNHISGVDVINKAVWKDGSGVMFGCDGADGGSVFQSRGTREIPSVRLKTILSSFDQIALLKMDIEGAETEVIVDCADELHRVEHLFVEYHSIRGRVQQLDLLLMTLSRVGFRYSLRTVGDFVRRPFLEPNSGLMDVQLDIHAVRQ